jgi:hypothetical protein
MTEKRREEKRTPQNSASISGIAEEKKKPQTTTKYQ